jgi:hypothetical protein
MISKSEFCQMVGVNKENKIEEVPQRSESNLFKTPEKMKPDPPMHHSSLRVKQNT